MVGLAGDCGRRGVYLILCMCVVCEGILRKLSPALDQPHENISHTSIYKILLHPNVCCLFNLMLVLVATGQSVLMELVLFSH